MESTNQNQGNWEDYKQVVYKVEEEWQELKEELTPNREVNQDAVFEELGDLLFSVAQLARHLNLDPHDALKAANKKFLRRFHAMEDLIIAQGSNIEEMNQDQMDVYWNQAKVNEKSKS